MYEAISIIHVMFCPSLLSDPLAEVILFLSPVLALAALVPANLHFNGFKTFAKTVFSYTPCTVANSQYILLSGSVLISVAEE